jgi:hypothetical protein
VRHIPPPTDDAGVVLKACASTVQDEPRRKAFLAIAPLVEAAAAEFASAAASARLNAIGAHQMVGPTITAADMVWLYENGMVRKGSRGRATYEALRASAPNGVCPLCGQRDASTLDHHLPKTTYPTLAVAPVNLVPACKDCNRAKLTTAPISAGEQTLHPYFDNVETSRWLGAIVMETSPAAVVYEVQAPSTWPTVMVDRVRHHFMVFGLGALYGVHAASELVSRKHRLTRLVQRVGAEGVRAFLTDERDAHEEVQLNSWQSALYRALAASDWYCRGGFAL